MVRQRVIPFATVLYLAVLNNLVHVCVRLGREELTHRYLEEAWGDPKLFINVEEWLKLNWYVK